VLTPWRAEISALTDQARQQTQESTTPEQAKENLVRMLQGARDASEKARGGVVKAGVPDVEEGDRIATGFTDSLTKVRDAYGRAHDAVKSLPTSDSAFYDNVRSAMTTLQQEYAASALDTTNLHSTELQAAFAEAPECH
jgi:hypothetical protein